MKKGVRRTVFTVLCMMLLSVEALAARMLVPGGQVIGIELQDGTVSVAAVDDTLGAQIRAAGIQPGDRILTIDGKPITDAQDVRYQLERSDGTVELEVEREGKRKIMEVKPAITRDGPRLGVYLRQGVTGVGTVSWYDPDTGSFGALGHGVNAPDGKLLSMKTGSVYEATVADVVKGTAGQPGQLLGSLKSREPAGTLDRNTDRGIFGKARFSQRGEPMAVAAPGEVRTGEATIFSTVGSEPRQEYRVEILKIYPGTRQTQRNMLLKVTDPRLLEATGGIVQGMSGSPLVQDGKLIGAVTHVLVNDPTMGYGIFIENMLEAAG
jgi:stage IV sporulation protein B